MEYRREIDGLRALAVLSVILFHAGFELFSGGFIGVDIFFVISGFLITRIILAELEQGTFSIVNFYERRARRILPALFFVMFVCIPFAWLLLPPSELTSFAKSVVAVPLFVSNFFFLSDGNYFETAAELKPLLHTWSLAVEEQYYVLFPILLTIIWRCGKKVVFWAVLMTALLSLALAQVGSVLRPVPNFFLLPTRAWELAIGALVAFYITHKHVSEVPLKQRRVLVACGFTFLLVSIFGFNSDTPLPSVYGLLPTLGTALVILFANKDTYIGKLLGSSILVGIGLISYSAYLWHQPILAFARYAFPSLAGISKAAMIVLILALSILSWKFVESPFRAKNVVSRKSIFSGSVIVTVFIVAWGGGTSAIELGREQAMAIALARSNAIYAPNMDERKFIKARIEYESLAPRTIVLGSSRIMQVGSHIAGREILNLSVSGASVEDDIAIWHLASQKFKPNMILISADPWLFNAKSGQDRWKTLEYEYRSALRDMGIDLQSPIPSSSMDDNSDQYLVRLYNAVNISKSEVDNDLPGLLDKIRRDGSRVYNQSFASRSRDEVERKAESFATYAMTPYEFSSDSKVRFEQFVAKTSSSYKVVLVLVPYHPKLYERMVSQDRKFIDIESQFIDLAAKLDIQIVGSYDPSALGCSDFEFFDGMHPKDSCMEKVIAQLRV